MKNTNGSDIREARGALPRQMASLIVAVAIALTVSAITQAQPVVYTDEASYLAAVSALGHTTLIEDFESSAWDGVRTTISQTNVAPSVTSQGITWSATDNVTTSTGAGRTGWGIYDHPGGDPDILYGTSAKTLYAIGGWMHTSTPVTNVRIYLDGAFIDNASVQVGTSDVFLGVVDPAGFNGFELRDTEGTAGDQKHWFADDFTFSVVETPRVPALSPYGMMILVLSLLATAVYLYRQRRRQTA